MSPKEKVYVTLSFAMVIFLFIIDFFLYRQYSLLANSPQSKINVGEVYEDYIKDLR